MKKAIWILGLLALVGCTVEAVETTPVDGVGGAGGASVECREGPWTDRVDSDDPCSYDNYNYGEK